MSAAGNQALLELQGKGNICSIATFCIVDSDEQKKIRTAFGRCRV